LTQNEIPEYLQASLTINETDETAPQSETK
jgi:hypothetical protein